MKIINSIKNYNQLNKFFKKFFNDFQIFVFKTATKHKLKRNYEEIENYS